MNQWKTEETVSAAEATSGDGEIALCHECKLITLIYIIYRLFVIYYNDYLIGSEFLSSLFSLTLKLPGNSVTAKSSIIGCNDL